jgi:hypothetical protein
MGEPPEKQCNSLVHTTCLANTRQELPGHRKLSHQLTTYVDPGAAIPVQDKECGPVSYTGMPCPMDTAQVQRTAALPYYGTPYAVIRLCRHGYSLRSHRHRKHGNNDTIGRCARFFGFYLSRQFEAFGGTARLAHQPLGSWWHVRGTVAYLRALAGFDIVPLKAHFVASNHLP